MRVLIAEDDPIAARILKSSLQSLDYAVTVARNGAEAWELFEADPVRIIVSDWLMPGLDGLELCQQVRELRQTEYIYFILLTGSDTVSESYLQAMAAGVDDFLLKPVNRDLLGARLQVAQRILRFTTQIEQLKELLPICSYCRKVRGDRDEWQQFETYLTTHTSSQLSHGVCPTCLQNELAELNKDPDG
jgi:phosphoserine phosphatase RsbU/P